jgi:hypothetical protein
MKRIAIAKVAAVAVLAVLIVGGAVGIYLFTSAPTTSPSTTSSTALSTSSGGSTTSQASGPSSGSQDSSGQPQGAWADYLGYIPAGYTLAPHYQNAATYPCPGGMDPTQCAQFKASCGNGVCDPNESCATCPIDCSVPGQLTCDPYTGRAGAPISICQMALNAPGG